jgi:hypothetical protein
VTSPQFIQQLYGYIHQLFTLDPNEPFKTGGKIVAIIGTLATIATTLVTKTYPWMRSKLDSHSIAKRIGAELYTKASLERAIKYYIPPYCQALDPGGAEEPRLIVNPKQKLFNFLDEALQHPTEYKFIFLLADSGMGKTSALINYYVRHIRRWRKPYNLFLIPLGITDVDERIEAIENKGNTVLFLDALDEDTLAIVDHIERLRILLKATSDFQRVLISCRTQFFSKDEEIPKETGRIKVGSRAAGEPAEYLFHKIYLSPFTDKQVASYLKHRYPFWNKRGRKDASAMVQKIPLLSARPMLLAHIDDLVQANRQIKYSFELYEEMVEAWLEREKGFIQNKESLRQFSELLAVNIFVHRRVRGVERIPKSELSILAKEWEIPIDEWKLSGRSLLNRDVEGNYKFAHRSIMEYLYVRRFLERDKNCVNTSWTHQMEIFLWEMLYDSFSKGQGRDFDTTVDESFMWSSDEEIQVLNNLLIRALGTLRLPKYPQAYDSDLIAMIIARLSSILLSRNSHNVSRAIIYRIDAPNYQLQQIVSYTNTTLVFSNDIQRIDKETLSILTESVKSSIDERDKVTENMVHKFIPAKGLASYPIHNYEGVVNYILVISSTSPNEIELFNSTYIKIILSDKRLKGMN